MATLIRVIDALLDVEKQELDPAKPLVTRHFSVAARDGRWVVNPAAPPPERSASFADFSRERGLRVNETVTEGPLALSDGDRIDTPLSLYLFIDGPVARNPQLERAAIDGDDAAWGVLADWLQEHDDPLGEHIAKQLGKRGRRCIDPPDDLPGLAAFAIEGRALTGDTWQRYEADEAHGLIRRLTLRIMGGVDAKLARLFYQRESRFLEELVIDVGGPPRVAEWANRLGTMRLPESLRRISFEVCGSRPAEFVAPRIPASLRERSPRLEETISVNFRSSAPTLEHASGERTRVVPGCALVRTEGRLSVVPERPVGTRHYAFTFDDGRWLLRSSDEGALERDRFVVRISGVAVRNTPLLHGDVIELGTQTLRFVFG